MNYKDLKRIIKENKKIYKYIYLSNFLTCNIEKMKHCKVSIIMNVFGKYEVTKWLDYDYGKYSDREYFSNKDLAANYAWELFGGDDEFERLLNENE